MTLQQRRSRIEKIVS